MLLYLNSGTEDLCSCSLPALGLIQFTPVYGHSFCFICAHIHLFIYISYTFHILFGMEYCITLQMRIDITPNRSLSFPDTIINSHNHSTPCFFPLSIASSHIHISQTKVYTFGILSSFIPKSINSDMPPNAHHAYAYRQIASFHKLELISSLVPARSLL